MMPIVAPAERTSPRFVYIIGSQCVGKTTLVNALATRIADSLPKIKFEVVQEVARTALKSHGFNRTDVRAGDERCLQLQKLVLHSQWEQERRLREQTLDLVLSDRSGIDPLVYTHMYCNQTARDEVMKSTMWHTLQSNMAESLVILCCPVYAWLADDGIRLMPLDWTEWNTLHHLFCTMLQDAGSRYFVLPADLLDIEERVSFVISCCQQLFPELSHSLKVKS